MIDENFALIRAHGNNIGRYRSLLRTNLSDLERQFIERRLKEEEAAITKLQVVLTPMNSMCEGPPSTPR